MIIILYLAAFLSQMRDEAERNFVQGMQPEELAHARRFLFEPQDFPISWTRVEPASLQLEKAASEACSNWHQRKEQLAGLNLSDFPWPEPGQWATTQTIQEAENLLAPLLPVTESALRASEIPGYDLGRFSSSNPYDIKAHDDSFFVFVSARALAFEAELAAHRRDWALAFQSVFQALRLTARHEASPCAVHLLAAEVQQYTLTRMARICLLCESPERLRLAADSLAKIEGEVTYSVLSRADLVGLIADLRTLKRNGYPATLLPGRPGISYLRQLNRLERRLLSLAPLIPVPTVPSLCPEKAESQAKAMASLRAPYRCLFTKMLLEELCPYASYAIYRPDVLGCETRESCSHCSFHLVRLLIAQRLDGLAAHATTEPEVGPEASALQAKLTDPFSGRPYRYDATKQRFSSVGPDKRDDHLQVTYDPTNGCVSAGDLIVP